MNESLDQRCVRIGVIVAVAATAVVLIGLPAAEAPAQVPPAPGEASTATSDCARCHTCAHPSAANPCLLVCTRGAAAHGGESVGSPGPDFVLLDMIKGDAEGVDRFGPVPFDHAGHARWAGSGEGCGLCHHHTPVGKPHPKCRTCHPAELKREDIAKPSLKGAYHRQCMGCHREWSHNTKCDACHATKVGEEPVVRTAEQALGHMNEPIPEPDTEIYDLRSKPAVGAKAIFRHKDHVQRFDLQCAECHRGDNCVRCHEEGKTHAQKARTPAEHHQDCTFCHAKDVAEGGRCGHCHWSDGQPVPAPFQHASTGWPLSRYHKDTGCRVCHKTLPFAKLERDCNVCHADWETGSFDHAVTGQRLNDTHMEVDCEECHLERRFDRPPTCEECHDEDIAFPDKRPGPKVDTDK